MSQLNIPPSKTSGARNQLHLLNQWPKGPSKPLPNKTLQAIAEAVGYSP